MVNLENIKRIYFIGIGGIGMSALARYFHLHGTRVSGYDRTETTLTRMLINEGIEVIYSDEASLAPKDADLVVYTPAVPAEHGQLNFYKANNYTLAKRSDVLGAITRSSFNICIAGTHGKTTVSTMVAHILRHTGYGCNAFLGGIAANYNTNFWSSDNNVCVVEADEYDRSFLKLSPDIAVITAMDADHLDIYGTEKVMQEAFVEFTGRLKQPGTLLVKKGLPKQKELKGENKLTYSIDQKDTDVYATNISLMNGFYLFDVKVKDELIEEVALNMGGLHNVENASVAIAVARELKIDTEAIKSAVEDFRGVKRRFEYIIKKKNLVYIDDYAHHPAELSALVSSARSLFPHLKMTVIFQPHLFTRTRDHADGFARSLDNANEVMLLPIYPARELPIEGVSSEIIREKMSNQEVDIVAKNEVVAHLQDKLSGKDLIITAGAGDIDTLVEPIKKMLTVSA